MLRFMMRRNAPTDTVPTIGAATGHDVLVSVRDGHLARPAAASLLDLSYDEIGPGRAVLGFRPSRRFADGTTVPNGVLAGVAECAMTTAVRTTVLAAVDVVTTSLTVDQLLPVAVDSGPLRCEAEVVGGPAVEGTLSRATVRDGAGRLVLRAQATCRVEPMAVA
jgi:acyl-coenzyme A thioesterase PaaI-like protein